MDNQVPIRRRYGCQFHIGSVDTILVASNTIEAMLICQFYGLTGQWKLVNEKPALQVNPQRNKPPFLFLQ